MIKKKEDTKKTVSKKAKVLPKKEIEKEEVRSGYIESIGRRKTAVARVRVFTQGNKEFLINDKPYKLYFPEYQNQQTLLSPLDKMKCLDRFKISVKLRGGGIRAQAEAVRHGIARALVEFNPNFRKRLRKAGFLTRDPRERERKKFGLKRARRAPQWKKR